MQPMATRTYDSTRRNRQAAQTRAEVLAAALQLFNDQGWAATTLADIAATAGVAVETIYSGFGSKKGLLRNAVDVGVVGDAEPVPFSERDEFLALGRGSLAERLQRAARVVADIHERSAGVWHALVVAAAADEEVESWRVEIEQNRRAQVDASVELMLGHGIEAPLRDLMWILYSSATYSSLTRDAGWDRPTYERWLVESTVRLLELEV
jgi:TetR/AcrR family transcriptional regulator, regulator of autoinduction and epiphytic fitness